MTLFQVYLVARKWEVDIETDGNVDHRTRRRFAEEAVRHSFGRWPLRFLADNGREVAVRYSKPRELLPSFSIIVVDPLARPDVAQQTNEVETIAREVLRVLEVACSRHEREGPGLKPRDIKSLKDRAENLRVALDLLKAPTGEPVRSHSTELPPRMDARVAEAERERDEALGEVERLREECRSLCESADREAQDRTALRAEVKRLQAETDFVQLYNNVDARVADAEREISKRDDLLARALSFLEDVPHHDVEPLIAELKALASKGGP